LLYTSSNSCLNLLIFSFFHPLPHPRTLKNKSSLTPVLNFKHQNAFIY
jgi:hypothetical protein